MEVKKNTVIRTTILVIALLNQALTSSGHAILPISDEEVNQVVTLAFTIGASIWAWWKNNSFTKAAIEADKVLKDKKGIEK
ncbi:phage holin [Intestinibacter bartlettii]|uniref:Phage holin n=1 Tax=Intestinibacter bartlettii TaxID=261299 RepID=A0ABS6DWN1_9FIRM|nr:phage holin [Intestinibacter bartlettii]MBU5336261.1 phage holin [Intestinibacter bartlettii]